MIVVVRHDVCRVALAASRRPPARRRRQQLGTARAGAGLRRGAHHPARPADAAAGEEGLSEDITLFMGEAADLPLEGEWTLGSFCDHLAALDQWPDGPPEWEMARRWRNWGYEAAALDLALRQSGRPLHEVLGREPRPVTFVNSLGLGDPPAVDTILRRLERYPGLRFKLDAAPTWTPEIVAALAGHGRRPHDRLQGPVRAWRSRTPRRSRGCTSCSWRPSPSRCSRIRTTCPRSRRSSTPHAARVSYDAPIHTVDDLDATPIPARTFNIKPTRIGSLRDLFAIYAACEERGLGCTAAAWASSASRAARSSCSPRSSPPTRRTTSRRPASTRSIRPPACP